MWFDVLMILGVVALWLLIAPCSPLRGACAWKRPAVTRSSPDDQPDRSETRDATRGP
jgi:hypothetical protein